MGKSVDTTPLDFPLASLNGFCLYFWEYVAPGWYHDQIGSKNTIHPRGRINIVFLSFGTVKIQSPLSFQDDKSSPTPLPPRVQIRFLFLCTFDPLTLGRKKNTDRRDNFFKKPNVEYQLYHAITRRVVMFRTAMSWCRHRAALPAHNMANNFRFFQIFSKFRF